MALLDRHQIATVCDVRSVPYSKYTPQFNREALAEALPALGISYHWLGAALGGMPQDAGLRLPDGSADYEKIMASPGFDTALAQLMAFGRRAPTAFMCGEADYRGCHRHKLLTPALIHRGCSVAHIMADGRLEPGQIVPQQISMF